MSVSDELVAANAAYASGFDAGALSKVPARRVAVVTCMDARVHPQAALGIELGDAHVIRNAGGRAAEALRSLVVSLHVLDVNEIVVMHHTDCGMHSLTNAELAERLQERLGIDAGDQDFLCMESLEAGLRDDVAFLRESEFIGDDITITGLIYDVRTGRVSLMSQT